MRHLCTFVSTAMKVAAICCNAIISPQFHGTGLDTAQCFADSVRGRLTGKAEHGHNDGFEGFLGTSVAARLNISEINGRRKTVGPMKLARMVICNIPIY